MTVKEAGLLVFDLQGNLRASIAPPNLPTILEIDPPTPAGIKPNPSHPCPGSDSGETFGRFNNVDVLYGVDVGIGRNKRRVDVAAVSDRGCDRVRFYEIRGDEVMPLRDLTDSDSPRVFPEVLRVDSVVQGEQQVSAWHNNPLDDQHTVYGLTVAQHRGRNELLVTQRSSTVIGRLRIVSGRDGTLSYEHVESWIFPTDFELENEMGELYPWSPCREKLDEMPQAEGLVFDAAASRVLVGFETIGLFVVDLAVDPKTPKQNHRVIEPDAFVEPVTNFGRGYWAVPDDDEFECVDDSDGPHRRTRRSSSARRFTPGAISQPISRV